ncbi:hypothetical protein [Breznakiella homolactica]|uniref:Uncharacterized protein n=1 Tax=Breznakiella homolactica TaxID=2798577 RepID=A0A7T7XM27_9SPIR|nr:hypothetical protein [Breznakiella homolactica]QQO08757.1 hypothetical protein JFL75_17790 [Breznakiella homolactica]
MKKLWLCISVVFVTVNLFSLSYSPDYKREGLEFDLDIAYGSVLGSGKIFDSDNQIIYMNMDTTMLHSPNMYLSLGLSALFSLNRNIFDLYFDGGITLYPFKQIFSLTFGFGMGGSYILFLNHFPYLLSAKANFDIPIYKKNYLTIGFGILHRNAVKIIDYLNLNSDYYGIYNAYFFEIGYRIIIK